jgi:hypothetical protein
LFNKYFLIFTKIVFSEIVLVFIQAKNLLIEHKNTLNAVKHIKKYLSFDFKNLLPEVEFPKFSWNNACWVKFIFQYFIKAALWDKFISCVLVLIKLGTLTRFHTMSYLLLFLNIEFPTLNVRDLVVNINVVKINFSWVVDLTILWEILMFNEFVGCKFEVLPKLILAFVVIVFVRYFFFF